MSPSPFILREISGADPSVSVKGTRDRSPPAVSGVRRVLAGDRVDRGDGTLLRVTHCCCISVCIALSRGRRNGRMNPQHCHLPIARITMHTGGEGRKSRPTPTPPPRISSRCERGNARYLPSFSPDPILLFRPFVVSSSEYARPTDVTPTLNSDHRQRATDDGRTERAGGTGSRAHALY